MKVSIYENLTSRIIDDEGIEQRDEIPVDPVGDKLILGFYCVEIRS